MHTADAPSCKELVELVTRYLEKTLSVQESARFEAHLDQCEEYRIYLEQLCHTLRVVGTLREKAIPGEVSQRLLHAFRSWKQGEGD